MTGEEAQKIAEATINSPADRTLPRQQADRRK